MSKNERSSIVREERGQASLMIGMMMMTFILLFAFVVNTGMLVNAKINLQNAADLAAYAGAAVQARQLNDISYLNYEMRRQYKKFLFRYYVIGNMASGYFPRPGNQSGGTQPQWGPGPLAAPPINYAVPAVCVAFTSTGPDDNYCQVGTLQHIIIPSTNAALDAFDAINATLVQQLGAIEALREANCGKIAEANTTLLLLWLFNTSPDLQSLTNALSTAGNNPALSDDVSILRISQAAAQGLGLIPRELILNERINTLKSYVNMAKQTGVTKAVVNTLEQQADPASNERTIQAFLSAYDTLGNNTFGQDTQISMDELLPTGGDGADLLVLNPIVRNFDAYSVQFSLAGNPPPALAQGQPTAADCVPQLTPITVHNVPLGVAKDPNTLTFYAIRLRATAQIMFSPISGGIDLTAYAAARPFGSRIGPPDATFTTSANGLGIGSNSGIAQEIPNLPVTQQDGLGGLNQGQGWDNTTILGTMYSQFFPAGQNPIASALSGANFAAGLQAGMVPNPVEETVYNIPNDAPDPFVATFDSLHQMSFWAPVVSPAKQSELQDVLASDLSQILGGTGTPSNAIAGSNAANSLIGALTNDIRNYVGAMQSGQGEILAGAPDGGGRCEPGSCVQEGVNIAHIQDPFVEPGTGQPIQMGSSIMIPWESPSVKTSYVTTLDQTFEPEGRVGYSVKFVSFDSLTKTGTDTTGSGPIVKPPTFLDTPGQQDVQGIQH